MPPSKRAAGLVGALSIAGLAISVYLARVHAEIAANVVPSCDVNETFSCTVVLSSRWAYVFDTVPVAWLALATYAVFAVAAFALAFAVPKAKLRRRIGGVLFAGAIGAAVYSVFLAFIAVVRLQAVCLFCTGLYVVNAGLLVATALLLSAVRRETSRGRSQTGLVRWAGAGALAGLGIVLGMLGWEATSGGGEIPSDFEHWYRARPVVEQPPVDGHAKGEASSPVVIAEFSDFECGHCARVYRTFKQVLPRYRDDVRVEFLHFPLDSACNPAVKRRFHRNACLAAVASECAATQGEFWPYHDMLFDNQNALARDDLLRYAEAVGLERGAFAACLDGEEARAAVARDVAEGARLEVKSTPTLFFNRRKVLGALEHDKLEYAIRIERASSSRRN